MFKRFRIAVLLYILLFVAVGQYLTARRSTDWNNPLWVDVYLVNSSGTATTQSFIDDLKPDAFDSIERFFDAEARIHGIAVDQPFRLRLAEQLDHTPPPVPEDGNLVSTVLWSLKMRWFVSRLHWSNDQPTPDITVFALYQDGDAASTLDRSTALRKGMIAIANLYADRSARGSNQMIIAHELLHTLGATDKYDLATTWPVHPSGFAEPGRSPLYPQSKAELMAGRIPIRADDAIVPQSLSQVMIGPVTAAEIGWTSNTDP